MKVSISLPEEDVTFLDNYSRHHQIASRSATLHHAIQLLRASELASDYAEAFAKSDSEEHCLWDSTVSDGVA